MATRTAPAVPGLTGPRLPAGRLGEVLVAGRIPRGSGLPPGTVRRHPTWGLTFVMAGTGRYRDRSHDEPITPGTLVLVHPGHPHWYGADRGGWDELFVVFDGVVFDLARRRGALSPDRPLIPGLPVPPVATPSRTVRRARPPHKR